MLNRRCCRGGRRHKLRLGRRKGGQGGGSMPPGGGDNSILHPTSYPEYGIGHTHSGGSRADSFEPGSMLMLLAML